MRLIDADRLLADLKEENVVPICIQNLTKKNKQIIRFENMIYEQPTAYDVDKVVEHLETARDGYSTAMCMTATNAELVKRFIAKDKAMNLAIEIVKAGGMNNNSKTSD